MNHFPLFKAPDSLLFCKGHPIQIEKESQIQDTFVPECKYHSSSFCECANFSKSPSKAILIRPIYENNVAWMFPVLNTHWHRPSNDLTAIDCSRSTFKFSAEKTKVFLMN